ncbi:unnamed protein product [Paramecium sonneborni]|uniref:Uncharacterized protein n=1 Tax=Paramecium sonneborni TaxID=65129 RepID=A0A8S1KX00_9CILI|nr:unnamed protein product [Paramecium sonneborni]
MNMSNKHFHLDLILHNQINMDNMVQMYYDYFKQNPSLHIEPVLQLQGHAKDFAVRLPKILCCYNQNTNSAST